MGLGNRPCVNPAGTVLAEPVAVKVTLHRHCARQGLRGGTGTAWLQRAQTPPLPAGRPRPARPGPRWQARSLAVAFGRPVVPLVVGLRLLCEQHLVEAAGRWRGRQVWVPRGPVNPVSTKADMSPAQGLPPS